MTGRALGDGFCAVEYVAKKTPMTAEAARGTSLRFIIPPAHKKRVNLAIFKYERAQEER
jgi:hypothetical protein